VHFADVGDERRLDAAGLAEQIVEAGEDLVVESDSRVCVIDMGRMVGARPDTIGPAPNAV
jgi:hypothetical protein